MCEGGLKPKALYRKNTWGLSVGKDKELKYKLDQTTADKLTASTRLSIEIAEASISAFKSAVGDSIFDDIRAVGLKPQIDITTALAPSQDLMQNAMRAIASHQVAYPSLMDKELFERKSEIRSSLFSLVGTFAEAAAQSVLTASENIRSITEVISNQTVNLGIPDKSTLIFNSGAIKSVSDTVLSLSSDLGLQSQLAMTASAISGLDTYLLDNASIIPEITWQEQATPYLELVKSTESLYAQISTPNFQDIDDLIYSIPIVETYSANRVRAVVSELDDESLEQSIDKTSEEIIDQLSDETETKLRTVDPSLAELYIEGLTAIQVGNTGWKRHSSVSFRELMEHLLRKFASDRNLNKYFGDDLNLKESGKWKRKARIQYIFKDVAKGAYKKMAEKDMDLIEATFFPLNANIHTPKSPLSEKQTLVLRRRIQGSLGVLFEVVEI